MKILKVKVKKERTLTHCHYSYPNGWNAEKINVLAYEEQPKKLGRVEEDCLCITDEETAMKLLSQPGAREVPKSEANAFGKKWRSVRAGITDEMKVISTVKKLLAKPQVRAFLKNHLNQDEIDSLNENKSNLGIEKGKEFDINEFI